jgi:argininosuccinate lyase
MTVWSERFEFEPDRLLRRHGDSFPFDRALLPEEIRSSLAHARALARAGIVPRRDGQRIVRGLLAIEKDRVAGRLSLDGDHEDVHSFVESELGRRIGPVAGRLHTGRSRNDQVATIYRLWLRDRVDGDLRAIDTVLDALLRHAETHPDVILPAYTHLQRAQPVLLAHHMLAHAEALLRDRARFTEARARIDVLPLGSGAGTGAGFPIDRAAVARELGFAAVSRNSLDAVSDRDFLLDYLGAAATLSVHLSRIAEEVVLWTTREFGFARLSDRASTGSSIMPQKRNPDGAELVRGRTGRILGHLVAVLTELKGLPLSYNKDLQEAGPAILDAAPALRASLELTALTLASMEVVPERMAAALTGGFAEATEAADFLVRRGVPFREAHGAAARLVLEAERRGLSRLTDLPDEVFPAVHPRLDAEVRRALRPESAVRARDLPGGTAPRRVGAEVRRLRRALSARLTNRQSVGSKSSAESRSGPS